MPSLTLPGGGAQDRRHSPERERSLSPTGPPYSPITPVLSTIPLAPTSSNYQGYLNAMQRPPSIPISESDNSDAIALRSALSILQIQRQQSLQDLKTLERQKQKAVADPENFAKALVSGSIKSTSQNALFDPGQESRENEAADETKDEAKGSQYEESIMVDPTSFGAIPTPQNIIRCPPINWAKYHVIGEALDKLHNEQVLRPTPGQPQQDGDPVRPPPHVIAAPYRPWVDKISDSPARTRSTGRKDAELNQKTSG